LIGIKHSLIRFLVKDSPVAMNITVHGSIHIDAGQKGGLIQNCTFYPAEEYGVPTSYTVWTRLLCFCRRVLRACMRAIDRKLGL
jgi:hypothetical protein